MTTITQPKPLTGNRVIHASQPITLRQPVPVIITIPRTAYVPQKAVQNTLSSYLERGRQMHPICRHSFVEQVELGYYHYERRTEWRTCALAAAYAGTFGATSVQRPEFSYSMALWQLSQKLGYDLRTAVVFGPTGRMASIAAEMVSLIDDDGWTRAGVSDWLRSLNL